MKSIGSSSRSLESGRLKVSFNPNAELVFIETVEEYTPDEIVSAYYQPHEYKQIKAENRILTRDLKERQLAPQNDNRNANEDMEMEVCYRGLEHKTESATKRRRQTRFESAVSLYTFLLVSTYSVLQSSSHVFRKFSAR